MIRSAGSTSRIRSSPPVAAASAMKLPTSMWSGEIVCSAPPRLSAPLTVITLEPIPSTRAPILVSRRARSWTWGSQAALEIVVAPGVSAAAISAFSVPITEGSSMKISQAQSPPGALSSIQRSPSTRAPRSLKASRWASRRRRPMKSPPGRRHPRLAEAGQQRAGEQERGADLARELLVDGCLGDRRGRRGGRCCRRPRRPRPRAAPAARSGPRCRGSAAPGAAAAPPRSAGRRRGSAAPRSCCRRRSARRRAARRLG